jgi:hypothetical protein
MNTASHREDIPNNNHPKKFDFNLFVERKIEICEKNGK